mgnify:CR=1 FL=1
MFRYVVILLVVFSPASSLAQTKFYQCRDQWGQPVFSQVSCGSGSIEGSVQIQKRVSVPQQPGEDVAGSASSPHSDSASVSDPVLNETQPSCESIKASNRIRDIEREIGLREGQVHKWEKTRDARIAHLRKKKRYANNGLAGATSKESISTQMQAAANRYDSKVDREQHLIDRLFDEKAELQQLL